MTETAGEQLARVRFEAEQRRRMTEPVTRSDVLRILDALHEYAAREKQYFIANVANVVRGELRDHWGLHG